MYVENSCLLMGGKAIEALTPMIAANNLVAMQDATSVKLDL